MKGLTIITATILSTVIHFFVLALLDTIPLVPKEIPHRPNIYMVDLVTLEPERPAPQEEPVVQKKAAETVLKKEEHKEVKKEEQKKEEVKREPKKEEIKKEPKKEDKVVLADRTKERENKESTETPQVDDEQQRLAAIKRIEQKVEERGAVTESEIQVYVAMARDRVKGFWVIPDTLSEKDLKAVIIIEIDRQGQVQGSRFEQSSGNLSFDQSAMRAVSKAAPFPPPPGQVPLEIGLIFQPR
jgi:colicin import membrane protein